MKQYCFCPISSERLEVKINQTNNSFFSLFIFFTQSGFDVAHFVETVSIYSSSVDVLVVAVVVVVAVAVVVAAAADG